MNIKVGVITFHASHNSGSILQTFAFQTVLKDKLNVDSEIIDFSNKGQRDYYSVYVPVYSFKHFVKNCFTLLIAKRVKNEYREYEEFINNRLKLSKRRYLSTDEMTSIATDYDCLICGSDQVWNVTCVDRDDAYFLSFARNTKKIAYATSLGAKNINKYAVEPQKYKMYLQDFTAISVREGNGKKWIEELMNGEGPDIHISVDPTLLLKKDEWSSYAGTKIISGKYIFYYAFNYTKEVNDTVKKISKAYGMPVYMFDVKSWGVKGNFRFGFKLADQYGPSAFLSLVKNAEMVLTTSFHGTVFSTIFEKKFWYLDSPMHSKDDDRASFLLHQLGLDDRLVEISKVKEMDLLVPPEFDISRKLVEELRLDSMKYLKDSICDGTTEK